MASLRFTKMHGLGNDFMVIDGLTQDVRLNSQLIRKWSDRHFGIGFDQLLLVEAPHSPDQDFRYRIFNADGSEVEQCGNGARCFASFVRREKLSQSDHIRVETAKGNIILHVETENWIEVDMGPARFESAQIPINQSTQSSYSMNTPLGEVSFQAISMGNPHAVLFVDDVDQAEVAAIGSFIEKHQMFPEGVNVGFAQIINRQQIKLRVWERGVGETLACGTGACAAAVAAMRAQHCDNEITVSLIGGDLKINWNETSHVRMTGPTAVVYDGVIEVGSVNE